MAMDVASQRVLPLIYGSLVAAAPSGELEPQLARSFRHQSFQRYWFELRQGLTFADGSPLDAEAVIRALRAYQSPGPYSAVLEGLSRLEKTRSGGIELWFKEPRPFFLHDLHLLRIAKFESSARAPVPSGAYRVLEHRSDGSIELAETKINLNVWNNTFWPRFRIQPVLDDTTRYQFFVSHAAAYSLNGVGLSKTHHLRNTRAHHHAFHDWPSSNLSYLLFNVRKGPLSSDQVRRAIAYALDRSKAVRLQLHGFASEADSLFPAHIRGSLPTFGRMKHSPAMAAELLDQVTPMRGQASRFQIVYLCTPEKTATDIARWVKLQLGAVGIEVRIELAEHGHYFERVRNGNFGLTSLRWSGINSPALLLKNFHSSQIPSGSAGGSNRAGYSNAVLDAVLEQLNVEPNETKHTLLFEKAQRILAQDLPVFPLWFWKNTLIAPPGSGKPILLPSAPYSALLTLRPPL
jgi:peptide/nickel transport system substrate-binding protein